MNCAKKKGKIMAILKTAEIGGNKDSELTLTMQ